MKYLFAGCCLDSDTHTLVRDGVRAMVEPQVFDLLLLLVENAHRLVTRDEIVDVVWHGRIVSESAISARIASARKAVGDDGKAQKIIATVARRGLRMVAEVRKDPQTVIGTAQGAPAAVQRIRYAANRDGHRIAWSATGDGRPVLRFSPPLTMDLEYEWRLPSERALIDEITRRFRYLRFDTLGSGQSERIDPALDFSAQAQDALCVADAAGLDRCAAVSFSGGVLAAVNFAAHYPERLERLVIVGGYVDGRVRRGQTGESDALKTLIAEGWGKPDSAFATAFLTSYFPEGPLDDVRDIVRMMQAACPLDLMLRDRDAINNATVAHLLDAVQCPVLIIHGRHDAVHPLAQAQKLASGIRDAELVVLETANHMPLPANACWPQFLDVLTDFLSS